MDRSQPGHLVPASTPGLGSLAGRSGFSCTPWSIWSTLHRWRKFPMLLCRRVVDNVMEVCRSLDSSIAEQVFEVPILSCFPFPRSCTRRKWNRQWKCRLCCLLPCSCSRLLSSPLTFQFRVGRGRRRFQGFSPWTGYSILEC